MVYLSIRKLLLTPKMLTESRLAVRELTKK